MAQNECELFLAVRNFKNSGIYHNLSAGIAAGIHHTVVDQMELPVIIVLNIIVPSYFSQEILDSSNEF